MTDQKRYDVPGMREWQIRTDIKFERMTDQNRLDVTTRQAERTHL